MLDTSMCHCASSIQPAHHLVYVHCRGRIKHKFDHLGCFIPAMLALGAQQGAVSEEKAQRYMSLAEDLAYTCWKMYSLQPTGDASIYVLVLASAV